MKIAIATDHNGVEQKLELIYFLNDLNLEVIDESKDNTPTDDYPDFAARVCSDILEKKADLGILMCGTGIGMSIAANKFRGIRCAKVSNVDEARLCRDHNNANIIALSYKEDILKLKDMIRTFVETPASTDERHIRRVAKITSFEE